MGLFSGYGRHSDAATPETSAGGPVYDARIDPAINAAEIVGSERLAAQRDLHLWGDKTAPAQQFSNYVQTQPSPLLGGIASLASSRDQIEQIVSRKLLSPFPGVELGHVPGFHNAPRTDPVMPGSVAHLALHAHLGPSRDLVTNMRQGRRRFGH